MQTYWDLTEKERAALTREGVDRFLDAELMTKGVLKVAPLVLESAPEVDEPQKRTVYTTGFSGFAFETAAQVEAFYALKPLALVSEYLNGGWRNSVMIVEDAPVAKDANELRAIPRSTFEASKSDLQRRAVVLDTNAKRREEYDAQTKAQDKVLAGVWEDWTKCRDIDAEHRRVIATFNDYVKTAGDASTAARFLAKVFSTAKITEAAEWCGVEIPDPRIVDAEFPEDEPMPPEARAADAEMSF